LDGGSPLLRQSVLALLFATLLLAGCAKTAGPDAPVTSGQEPGPATSPATSPTASGPDTKGVTDEIPPCWGSVDGPPTIWLTVQSVRVEVPLMDCRLTVAAGMITFTLLGPGTIDGKPLVPPEELAKISVSGASAKGWEGELFQAAAQVEHGKVTAVTFDLRSIGRSLVTYTLTGGSPQSSFLAAALDRKGPWTPVSPYGLLPADAAWLKVSYPVPMPPGANSPVMADQYTMPGNGLNGEWEGDRTQYVAIGNLPPVLYVREITDGNGVRLYPDGYHALYRGPAPELQAVQPATGVVRTIYRYADVPGGARLEDGNVHYAVGATYRQIDPATGQISPGAEPTQPESGPGLKFPSPDGKLVAELSIPAGSPYWNDEPKPRFGDLVIRDSATDQIIVKQEGWLSVLGTQGCGSFGPGFAWRPDSRAVAALNAPDRDQLAVKMIDLQGQSRIIAQKPGQGAAWEQYAYDVTWSPSASRIKYGDQLVEVASGRLIAEKLARYSSWSPDSKSLLLYEPFHPFTSWGPVSLLDATTGNRQELGYGQGLGWLPTGEALFIRWDLSKQIPGPGKDC